MPAESFHIRALHSQAEITACARLLVETFERETSAAVVDAAVYHITYNPDIEADGLRAIFDENDQIMAQYVVHTRRLCIGPARLPVHCIGGVAVRPDLRKHGLGSVLIRDSLDFAREHGVPLLLLTGIPNYYHRFGYAPVMPETQIFVRRDEIRRIPAPDDITLRTATVDDAPQILNLYHRHMHPVLGSFDRSLDEQRYYIERPHANRKSHFLLASDSGSNPTGYLLLTEHNGEFVQRETAAGDWPTVAALLNAHEDRLPDSRAAAAGEQRSGDVHWQVSARSRLNYALIDHIPCRVETFHHPNAGWMARLDDIDAYMRAMMPAWQTRIADASVDRQETVALTIGSARRHVQIADGKLALLDAEERMPTEATIELSPEAAVQLTFGFRPAAHIAERPDVNVPPHLVDLLGILYPLAPAGVAGTDYF